MSEQKNYVLSERTIDIYLQKSLKFLYPLLKIGPAYAPLQSYLVWNGENAIKNRLILVYELKETFEFKQFERKVLQGNELFETFKEGENNKGIYFFDLTKYKNDMQQFYLGRYSKMSFSTKKIILDYYKYNSVSLAYFNSYLNPGDLIDPKQTETYFERYATLLNVSEELLRNVGELCDKYDMKKETLMLNVLESKLI